MSESKRAASAAAPVLETKAAAALATHEAAGGVPAAAESLLSPPPAKRMAVLEEVKQSDSRFLKLPRPLQSWILSFCNVDELVDMRPVSKELCVLVQYLFERLRGFNASPDLYALPLVLRFSRNLRGISVWSDLAAALSTGALARLSAAVSTDLNSHESIVRLLIARNLDTLQTVVIAPMTVGILNSLRLCSELSNLSPGGMPPAPDGQGEAGRASEIAEFRSALMSLVRSCPKISKLQGSCGDAFDTETITNVFGVRPLTSLQLGSCKPEHLRAASACTQLSTLSALILGLVTDRQEQARVLRTMALRSSESLQFLSVDCHERLEDYSDPVRTEPWRLPVLKKLTFNVPARFRIVAPELLEFSGTTRIILPSILHANTPLPFPKLRVLSMADVYAPAGVQVHQLCHWTTLRELRLIASERLVPKVVRLAAKHLPLLRELSVDACDPCCEDFKDQIASALEGFAGSDVLTKSLGVLRLVHYTSADVFERLQLPRLDLLSQPLSLSGLEAGLAAASTLWTLRLSVPDPRLDSVWQHLQRLAKIGHKELRHVALTRESGAPEVAWSAADEAEFADRLLHLGDEKVERSVFDMPSLESVVVHLADWNVRVFELDRTTRSIRMPQPPWEDDAEEDGAVEADGEAAELGAEADAEGGGGGEGDEDAAAAEDADDADAAAEGDVEEGGGEAEAHEEDEAGAAADEGGAEGGADADVGGEGEGDAPADDAASAAAAGQGVGAGAVVADGQGLAEPVPAGAAAAGGGSASGVGAVAAAAAHAGGSAAAGQGSAEGWTEEEE